MTKRYVISALLGLAVVAMIASSAMAQCGCETPDCCEPACIESCAPACQPVCETVEKTKTVFSSECQEICLPKMDLLGQLFGRGCKSACGPCGGGGCDVGCDTGCDVGCNVGCATGCKSCGLKLPKLAPPMECKQYVSKKLLLKKVPNGCDTIIKCVPCDAGMEMAPAEEAAPVPAAPEKAAMVPTPAPQAMLVAPMPVR